MAGLEGKEQSLERAFLKSESELGNHRGGWSSESQDSLVYTEKPTERGRMREDGGGGRVSQPATEGSGYVTGLACSAILTPATAI